MLMSNGWEWFASYALHLTSKRGFLCEIAVTCKGFETEIMVGNSWFFVDGKDGANHCCSAFGNAGFWRDKFISEDCVVGWRNVANILCANVQSELESENYVILHKKN